MLLTPLNISPLKHGRCWVNNKSLTLNGTTQSVNIDTTLTALASTTVGTFSIPIKLADATPAVNSSIISFSNTTNSTRIRAFILTSGQIQFEMRNSAGTVQWQLVTTSQALVNNTWSVVHLVQDGVSPYIVVDKLIPAQSFVVSTNKTAWFNGNTFNNARLGVIELSTGETQFLNGTIGNFLAVNRALTLPQCVDITNDYNLKNESGISDGVTYLRFGDNIRDNWNLDNSNEWTFYDSIGSNNAVTINSTEASVVDDVINNLISINTNFTNSIIYSNETTYNKRPTSSEFNFNTSAVNLSIKANVDNTRNKVGVIVNGVYNQEVTLANNVWTPITLSAGSKYVQLIEQRIGTTSLEGCRINALQVKPSITNVVPPSNVSDRLVILGHSIAQGASATNQYTEGYGQLIKFAENKNVTVLGYGGATLREFALTSTEVDTSVLWINKAFADTTTTKKLLIDIGINDFITGYSAANIGTWLGQLLDGIILADPTIQIYCLTPLECSTSNATLVDIRAAMAAECVSRSVTVIDGTSILTYPTNYADTLHPDTTGHSIVKGVVFPVIYP